MIQRDCKNCGDPFIQYRSTQNLCGDCEYQKQITSSLSKKRRKRINPAGKVTQQWYEVDRPKWFKNHPPSHEGYYECYLQISPRCPKFMLPAHTTLDHVKARSSNPGKRRKQQNFKPACRWCNQLKGSISLDRIKKLYPKSKVAKT